MKMIYIYVIQQIKQILIKIYILKGKKVVTLLSQKGVKGFSLVELLAVIVVIMNVQMISKPLF